MLDPEVCGALKHTSTLFPSYSQIWCWVNNDFTNTASLGPAPLCVCANVDGLPLQKSVKIAKGFSLYFAILMGVRVHSSCFAYRLHQIVASQVPQNSKAVGSAPDQTATFPEKSLVHLLAVVVGGWCWGCGGLVGFMFACFMWTLMSV